jgi:hypothetical protein
MHPPRTLGIDEEVQTQGFLCEVQIEYLYVKQGFARSLNFRAAIKQQPA